MKESIRIFLCTLLVFFGGCTETQRSNPLDKSSDLYDASFSDTPVDTTLLLSSQEGGLGNGSSSLVIGTPTTVSSSTILVSESAADIGVSSVSEIEPVFISIQGPSLITMSEDSYPVPFNVILTSGGGIPTVEAIWSVSKEPVHGTIAYLHNDTGIVVEYKPVEHFNGTDAFEIQITDGYSVDIITIVVKVDPINDYPVLSAVPELSDETIVGQLLEFPYSGDSIVCTDVEGGATLSFEWYRDANLEGYDGVRIANQDSVAYMIHPEDVEYALYARVTCTDDDGISVSAFSSHRLVQPVPQAALQFDGIDDFVKLPTLAPDFENGLTIEAWVKWDALNFYSRIIELASEGPSNCIVLTNKEESSTLRFSVFDGAWKGVDVENYIDLHKWTHVAISLSSSGEARMYKNGVLVHSEMFTVPVSATRSLNRIGKSNGVEEFFEGAIDDVRIWNTVRSVDEIKTFRFTPLSGAEKDLVAHWDFNNSEGMILWDNTIGDADGELINMNGSEWVPQYSMHTISTVSAGNGSVFPNSPFDVAETEQLAIEAVPAVGYYFDHWDVSQGGSVREVNQDKTFVESNGVDVIVTAHFEEEPMNALQFADNTGFVDLPDMAFDFSNGITFETWVKWDSGGRRDAQNQRVFEFGLTGVGNSNSIELGCDKGSTRVYATVYVGTTPFTVNSFEGFIKDDTWIHIAVVYDGTDLILYKDGSYHNNVAVTTPPQNLLNRTGNYIGKSNLGQDWHVGAIDDFRIWGIARSQTEIAHAKDKRLMGTETALEYYWNFNQRIGSQLYDRGPHAAHGLLHDMGIASWVESQAIQ